MRASGDSGGSGDGERVAMDEFYYVINYHQIDGNGLSISGERVPARVSRKGSGVGTKIPTACPLGPVFSHRPSARRRSRQPFFLLLPAVPVLLRRALHFS